MRRAVGRLLGRLVAWCDRKATPAEPPPLAKWQERPAREFRCWCGAPSAADEPVLCHSCRAEGDRRAGHGFAEVVDLPMPAPLSIRKRARG